MNDKKENWFVEANKEILFRFSPVILIIVVLGGIWFIGVLFNFVFLYWGLGIIVYCYLLMLGLCRLLR